MGFIGSILAVLAILGAMLAFIPLLGWLNWLNIPFAILALIFSIIGQSKTGKSLAIAAIIIGVVRLMLGGGIF
jgi:hypothetical protein